MEIEEVPLKKRKVQFEEDGGEGGDLEDVEAEEAPERTGLPHSVSIKDFLAGREDEIKLLRTFLKGKTDKKMTVAQRSLPISMRRRAMSHNAKRFPKRLRTAALIKQIGESKTTKRPSRKYRRKPRNLLAEYIRRQRDHIWLETHIWHAKRFRMSELWGYKIATRCNAKIYRSSNRAVKSDQSCLMIDVSYLTCLELRGNQETLDVGFRKLTDGSLPGMDDRKEANVLFHHPKLSDGAATQLIGPVRVLRLPGSTNAAQSVLWLWVHPSIFEEVLGSLKEAFSLSKIDAGDDPSMVFCPEELAEYAEEESSEAEVPVTNGDSGDVAAALKTAAAKTSRKKTKKNKSKKKAKENIDLAKLKNKNVPFERTPKYSSPETNVELIVLKDTLNRLRFIGRGCRSILTEVLRPVNPEEILQCKWFADFKEDFNEAGVDSDDLRSVEANGSILSLIVRDPRALLPPKRLQAPKFQVPKGASEANANRQPNSAHWPITSHRVRDNLISTKVPDSKINALRKELREKGKDGDELKLGADEACVPLLVVPLTDYQVSDPHDLDAGLVCDVIIPAGWGMSFWIPFVFRNAKVGCLKELSSFSFESSSLVFPRDYPDTRSGHQCRQLAMDEGKEEYFKHPPAHRPNYIKLGVFWPFGAKYDELLQRCVPELDEEACKKFCVLRDEAKLQFVRALISKKSPFQVESSENRGSFRVILEEGQEDVADIPLNALMWVKLTSLGKGTLADLSMIYIPHPLDLAEGGTVGSFNLWEENHDDVQAATRAKLRAEHKAELERAHRRRQRQRRRRREQDPDQKTDLPRIKAPSEEDHAEFSEKMGETFLPDVKVGNERLKNIREVFGIVERGDYSLARGRGKALGLVSCYRLVKMIAEQRLMKDVTVLVRGITTLQYVKAELNVL